MRRRVIHRASGVRASKSLAIRAGLARTFGSLVGFVVVTFHCWGFYILADAFALYLKTKNFHWHVSGPHFRDYHLMLDEQGEQIFATTDDIAERVRKIGGTTIRSIGHIGRLKRVLDNDADYVTPEDMLAELRDDNKQLTASLREAHAICDKHEDVASASLIENWIDEAERRTWFLFEATRVAKE